MVIALTLILFTLGLCAAAAVSDVARLKIPNLYPLAILATFVGTVGLDLILNLQIFENITTHLIVGVVTFVIMLICFFTGMLGGGDAKMIAVLALWIGASGLPVFLLAMTLTGAMLAIIGLLARHTKLGQSFTHKLNAKYSQLNNGWIGALAENKNVVPYGVAILIGAIAGFRSSGLLP